MRTPVYPLRLFAQVLRSFPERSELCVVRKNDAPISAALVLHGDGVTEAPSAGSLRSFRPTCANMLMYWLMLERAIEAAGGDAGHLQRAYQEAREAGYLWHEFGDSHLIIGGASRSLRARCPR